jgi:hypothetical protein
VSVLREASGLGPCAVLGTLVSETSTRYIYRRRPDGPIALAYKRSPGLLIDASRAPTIRGRATATCGEPLWNARSMDKQRQRWISRGVPSWKL